MLSLFNPFEARWPANSKLRLYVVVTPVSVASWPETISRVRISVQGRSLWCCEGVTKTAPIIGNFLTFWWFCLLITVGYWLQTIWETFFHISKILYHISKLLLILLMNIVFQKKTSMLRLPTKINHFLLSLVVAWSGSSQIWSLFEHDESWCSGSVSIIRTLQSTLWTHGIHTSSSCILRKLIFSFWKWFFNSNAIVKFFLYLNSRFHSTGSDDSLPMHTWKM